MPLATFAAHIVPSFAPSAVRVLRDLRNIVLDAEGSRSHRVRAGERFAGARRHTPLTVLQTPIPTSEVVPNMTYRKERRGLGDLH